MTQKTRAQRPSTPEPITRSPRIITVASGKGGVGKTWLSTSLASALSFKGRRVLLFDGDLGLANVDVQLGLTPSHDLGSVIAGRMPLREAVTPYQGGAGNTAPPRAGGFDVLAGRSGSGALSVMRPEELRQLAGDLRAMSKTYNHLIIDLAAGIDNSVTVLSTNSDLVLVVLTDEPTSLTDAYAFVKITAMREPSTDVRIVVNMADSIQAGRRTYQALTNATRNFLGIEPALAGIIARDPKVKDSIRTQTPIFAKHPQSTAAKQVSTLATEIAPGA